MTDNTAIFLDIRADGLYDQARLAEMLGKPTSWFERTRWSGTGPKFIKIGRSVRYRGVDVLTWLESQTRSSTADQGGGDHAEK